jgi:hypothetical protein
MMLFGDLTRLKRINGPFFVVGKLHLLEGSSTMAPVVC